MDDVFYIILGLVWVGLAIYRNAQKKKLQKAKDQSPAEQEEQVETFEAKSEVSSLLEELLMGQKQPTFYDETSEEETAFDQENIAFNREPVPSNSFEEEYDRMGLESVEELDPETIEAKIASMMADQKPMEVLSVETAEKEPFEFDLKKAIIYSEILNRRYF